jgi:hypothetical protein
MLICRSAMHLTSFELQRVSKIGCRSLTMDSRIFILYDVSDRMRISGGATRQRCAQITDLCRATGTREFKIKSVKLVKEH